MTTFRILPSFLLLIAVANAAIADPAREIRKETESLLKSGNYSDAYEHAQDMLIDREPFEKRSVKKNRERLVSLFKDKYPASLPFIVETHRNRIMGLADKSGFLTEQQQLKKLGRMQLMVMGDIEELEKVLIETAISRNLSGEAEFLLTDNFRTLPALMQGSSQLTIYRRSVDLLTADARCCVLMRMVLEAARASGSQSEEKAYLESKLGEIDFPISILKDQVIDLYPDLAQQLISEREIILEFVNDSSDELLVFEVLDRFDEAAEFRVVEESEAGSLAVMLKKFKLVDKEIAESSQTIRYGYYDVNPVTAVLLMPKNASYVFDLVSGGYQVKYFGVVVLAKDGQTLHTERISGDAEERYSYCRDARIINVFGGVQPADFVPNADFANRCSENKRTVDSEIVYQKAIDGLVEEITKLEPIANRL